MRNRAPVVRHKGSRQRLVATLVAGLVAGVSLPGTAFAPAAQAHDRIDASPRAAQALAEAPPSDNPSAWDGLPVADQEPPTATLIASDLAALPRLTQEAGTDAVRFGARSVPRRVVDTIVKAAEEAGVDPVYMMALADKESSFDTGAKAATSSAQGLFQFVTATWLEMIRDHGTRYGLGEEAASVTGRGGAISVAGAMRERVLALRNDPRVAALMAAELAKRERGRIEAKLGRALSATELYLAHVLGGASAGRFLSLSSGKPDAVAGRAFPTAARANRDLFTQNDGGKRRNLTVAELHGRIRGMIDRRINRYEGSRPSPTRPKVRRASPRSCQRCVASRSASLCRRTACEPRYRRQCPAGASPPSLTVFRLSASGTAQAVRTASTQNTSM